LQFSILHPCFAPRYRKSIRDESGALQAVAIAGYYDTIDGEIETWINSRITPEERENIKPFQIPRFYRTLSEWVDLICQSGFVLRQFCEPRSSLETVHEIPSLDHTRCASFFLHVRAVKPESMIL
jgi:hypothetical protein